MCGLVASALVASAEHSICEIVVVHPRHNQARPHHAKRFHLKFSYGAARTFVMEESMKEAPDCLLDMLLDCDDDIYMPGR